MKKTWMTIGSISLLCGCTAVPIAVTPPTLTRLTPQPQALPMVKPSAYKRPAQQQANAQTPMARPIPIPSATVKINTPPALSPTANDTTQTKTSQAQAVPIPNPTVTLQNSNNLGWIAKKIHQNQRQDGKGELVKWNSADDFVALGIGRFVWYPAGKRGRYKETFPAFLVYAESQRAPLPTWLAQRPTRGGPWATKAAFERAQKDSQMQELRDFMRRSGGLQVSFLAAQQKRDLINMAQQLPQAERQKVLRNYQTVRRTPGGLYPLLDYTLFQGDGGNKNERYQNQGWGLLQVLKNMEHVQPGKAALAEFMRAADDVLVRRVANSPIERREARLLSKWQKRLQTYRAENIARR